ncbi:LysR substrate-binding domain-containing protein [Niveibacterium sp. 24ML]|uniref:LysR substrate-binding domain-containing protein n=1 Tax=Niveibacterium sp. 24ML TaxID=2985512 RepID=UPI00226F7D25|nr:LysR substrate-binding domain-containing protein [Niveibacterium sp. 24ML]MCX9158433.1 LysR substrate-binding domain-containing protein [Niveibacterium sp. 24ML]
MRRLPPLASLEAFDAAARLGSFLAAAEALAITPSAVSHRIRALETALGLRLFERRHRSIVLTETGATYHAAIGPAIDALAHATARLQGEGHRSLALSVAPAFGRAWLVERLAAYQTQQPGVEFSLSTSTRLDPIQRGEADLAIRFVDQLPGGLNGWKLFDETVFPVCQPAQAEQLRAPADLLRARLLRHPLLSWPAWFAAAGVSLSQAPEGPRYDDGALMLDACAAGQGVALATSTLAAPWLANGKLVRPFAIELAQGSYHLIAAPGAHDKPWVIAFARWLCSAAHQAGAASRAA